MTRLTITLSETRYRALKTASAQRGRSIGELIDISLEFYGIKPREDALALVAAARDRASLDDDEAATVANAETRAVRAHRRR